MRLTTLVGLVLGLIALTGCSTYKVRPMPQMKAVEAPSRASLYGIDFGAKAFSESAEVKATFNYNMLDQGFLPVHLVVNNTSSNEIELVRARIEFETSGGERLEPVAADAASTGEGRNAMAEAIFFFGIFSYDNANKFNADLQRDWAEKGMGEVHLIRPGRTMSKFLYFQVGADFSPSGARLRVPFERGSTLRRESVILRFD